jgi:hypothetical protein
LACPAVADSGATLALGVVSVTVISGSKYSLTLRILIYQP